MTTSTAAAPPLYRRYWYVLPIALAALALLFWAGGDGDKTAATGETALPVKQGDFVISLNLKGGELAAVKSNKVTAPRVRGELKIVHLWEEGKKVDIGDLIVQFDQAEFQQKVAEAEEKLQLAKAEKDKTEANQRVEISQLEADIKTREAGLRLSEIQVQKTKLEATLEREKAELELRRAELDLAQAKKKLTAQLVVNKSELTKLTLDIAHRERDLEKSQRDFNSLSISAQTPGLVVYEKIWKGNKREKIRIGDTPWGGQTLVDLPDLTKMQVLTTVNEVDVDKIKAGQKATIKLDALPDPTFNGTVTSVATLGHQKEGEQNVKVFDVIIAIDEEDERLKPGMSAVCQVIIETITDQLSIPLEAVFEQEGKTVVYRLDGSTPKVHAVELGKKNDNYIIVESGLAAGDQVSLRDPNAIGKDIGGLEAESGGDAGEGTP